MLALEAQSRLSHSGCWGDQGEVSGLCGPCFPVLLPILCPAVPAPDCSWAFSVLTLLMLLLPLSCFVLHLKFTSLLFFPTILLEVLSLPC